MMRAGWIGQHWRGLYSALAHFRPAEAVKPSPEGDHRKASSAFVRTGRAQFIVPPEAV